MALTNLAQMNDEVRYEVQDMFVLFFLNIERFSCDLEMKTKQKQETDGKRAIWLVNRRDTNARGFWLVTRTLGWRNFMPKNFLEFNRYFALTSYCNTIGQSNNALSTLVYFWRENEECMFWSFHPLADKTNNERLPKPFFKVIRKSPYFLNHFTTRTWYR